MPASPVLGPSDEGTAATASPAVGIRDPRTIRSVCAAPVAHGSAAAQPTAAGVRAGRPNAGPGEQRRQNARERQLGARNRRSGIA